MSPTHRILTDAQRLNWLRLIRTENVGSRTFRSLINHCGGAEAALEALPDLARRGGARTVRIATRADAERELAAIRAAGAELVALGEPGYPTTLAGEDNAPPLLTIWGSALPALPLVAIVGARNASAAGRTFAARLARGLGEAGFGIISGLARGIDAAAHEAALTTGTVAALAGGLDRIYPPEHVPLLQRIVDEGGGGMTEMPMGWSPRAQDFPRRNRLIAGAALGTVIIEAAVRSGSLITARMAAEMGREVMAAPGSPLDPRCDGSNGLLRDGATLILNADHVIEGLAPQLGRPPKPPEPLMAEPDAASHLQDAPPDQRARILELLGPSPASLDDVVRLSGCSVGAVQLVLLELDLAGRLERHRDGYVSLRA